MTVMRQSEVGRCSFIDVLEEAVLRHRPIAVRLLEGATFIDQVLDVVTENWDDFAVFKDHARARIGEILAVTRAEFPRP